MKVAGFFSSFAILPSSAAAGIFPPPSDCVSRNRERRKSAVSEIEPGMRVRQPDRPDWGLGQVQSVIGNRVTVNFEHAGKLLLNLAVVTLEQVED